MRSLLAFLLIAVLLACPLICRGGVALSGAPTCCAGCGHHEPASTGDNNRGPAPEKREQSQGGCLCKGAIVDGARVLSDLAQLTVYCGSRPAADLNAADRLAVRWHDAVPLVPADHSSGRALRVLMASLVI